MNRPLGWKDTFDKLVAGWTLQRIGMLNRRARIVPPEGAPGYSERVHKSAFHALMRAGIIEPVPGQGTITGSRNPVNFRLAPVGKKLGAAKRLRK